MACSFLKNISGQNPVIVLTYIHMCIYTWLCVCVLLLYVCPFDGMCVHGSMRVYVCVCMCMMVCLCVAACI